MFDVHTVRFCLTQWGFFLLVKAVLKLRRQLEEWSEKDCFGVGNRPDSSVPQAQHALQLLIVSTENPDKCNWNCVFETEKLAATSLEVHSSLVVSAP